MKLTINRPMQSETGWIPSGVVQYGDLETGIKIQEIEAGENVVFKTEQEAKYWLEVHYKDGQ